MTDEKDAGMIRFGDTGIELARKLDEEDRLAGFRDRFYSDGEDCIYLDGNSLGRLPLSAVDMVRKTVEEQWGSRMIRG